jgi:carboxypeptidase C (cathepsin A)
VGDELTQAMMRNPHMQVMFCSGIYDLATPYFATDYTINHLKLTPELRQNIRHNYYEGGHMMYHHHASLEKLNRDVGEFMGAALK